MDVTVAYQPTAFTGATDALFETAEHIVLGDVGPLQSSGTLGGASGTLVVGEAVTLDGAPMLVLGSGFVQAGINLYEVPVALGPAHDVILLEDRRSEQLVLAYPKSHPDLLGASMIILDVDPVGYDLMANAPVCFCRGTMIMTPLGERPVETLEAGDQVVTSHGKVVSVLWAARRRYDQPLPQARPIVFERGALGDRLPRRRLRLSPWHRVPLPGTADRIPLLAPAAALTRLPRVRPDTGEGPVSYHHFVTERHALVLAEGQPVETLFPADPTLRNLSHDLRAGLLSALGATEETLAAHPAAQPCGRFLDLQDATQILRAAITVDFAV